MSAVRELILEYGGSFDRIPAKAFFWMPHELQGAAYAEFCAKMLALDKGFKPCNRESSDGWTLFRFVGRRKNYRTVRVNDRNAPHGVNPHLVFRIYPDGVIEIREAGRKIGYQTTAAAIYTGCLLAEVRLRQWEKRKAKQERKRSRRRK